MDEPRHDDESSLDLLAAFNAKSAYDSTKECRARRSKAINKSNGSSFIKHG